jgi:hypothetical protein
MVKKKPLNRPTVLKLTCLEWLFVFVELQQPDSATENPCLANGLGASRPVVAREASIIPWADETCRFPVDVLAGDIIRSLVSPSLKNWTSPTSHNFHTLSFPL